jgi:hypothetical protein
MKFPILIASGQGMTPVLCVMILTPYALAPLRLRFPFIIGLKYVPFLQLC